MPRRAPLLALAALLVLLAAGCGDDETVSGDEPAAAQTTTPPAAAQTTANGCERVEEPAPKTDAEAEPPGEPLDRSQTHVAVLETSCGTLEIRLAVRQAPKTTASFASLAQTDFYDGLTFHRIVPGFVVQGGDPAGQGTGGPGYEIEEPPPADLRYERGVVAMAKAAADPPGTSGSQFFIVTAEDAGLPPDYAYVGRVVGGEDVLERLATVPTDPSTERPTEPVVIEDVTIRSE